MNYFKKLKITITLKFQSTEIIHARILLCLEESYKIKTLEQVDAIVSAEIPDKIFEWYKKK